MYVTISLWVFWFFSFWVPAFLANTVQPTIAKFLLLSLPGLCLICCVVFEFCSEEGIATLLVGFLLRAFPNEPSACWVMAEYLLVCAVLLEIKQY